MVCGWRQGQHEWRHLCVEADDEGTDEDDGQEDAAEDDEAGEFAARELEAHACGQADEGQEAEGDGHGAGVEERCEGVDENRHVGLIPQRGRSAVDQTFAGRCSGERMGASAIWD